MPVNCDKPHLWKNDVIRSVDFFNQWFLQFAPQAYRDKRRDTAGTVEQVFQITLNLTDLSPTVLRANPHILPILRMSTVPPIARDRLIGLAGVTQSIVKNMEEERRLPHRMSATSIDSELSKISRIIVQMLDRDMLSWLSTQTPPAQSEIERSAAVIADRLCGMMSDPIIRNAQEQRQLTTLKAWLEPQGYKYIPSGEGTSFDDMEPGTFTNRLNVPVTLENGSVVNISIDTVIMPLRAVYTDYPLFIEAKSAGDFTNTNKRRKEEAAKMTQLKATYGEQVRFILFLCGYFDTGYLGYEAAEGIDWVWEHRIDDLTLFGV